MFPKLSEPGVPRSRFSRERRLRRSAGRKRRGAVLVEMAMCISLLFLLMFALIEFSRVLQIQHVAREAAFEGAREAASLDATTQSVQAQVNKVLSAGNLINVTTTITDGNGNALAYSSSTATVSVSVDPAGNSWFINYVTPGNPISATITLDREIQAVSVPGP